jgi:hypothetical protein
MKSIVFLAKNLDGSCTRPHCMSDALLDDLRVDLQSRDSWPDVPMMTAELDDANHPLRTNIPAILLSELGTLTIDFGGMAYKEMPRLTVDAGEDCLVDIPADHVDQAILELARLEERTFPSGRKYYKLHGFWAALVMSSEQYVAIRDRLIELQGVAGSQVDQFYRQRPECAAFRQHKTHAKA